MNSSNLSQPLWGMISDRTKTIKKIMLLYFFLMPLDPLTESLNFQSAEARIGGWFYESFGGKQLYLWISGVSFIGLLFSLVLSTVYGKAKMAS